MISAKIRDFPPAPEQISATDIPGFTSSSNEANWEASP